MDKKPVYKKISELEAEKASHQNGLKKVLLKGLESEAALTQIAYGVLKNNESVESHSHFTMEEHFYITSGNGVYIVDGKEYLLEPGVYILIPAKAVHSMKCTGPDNLEFFYFGLAI